MLTARLPRITCDACGVRQVKVPWARPGSGFTVLFEALVLTLAKEMPAHAIAQLVQFNIERVRAEQNFVAAISSLSRPKWQMVAAFPGRGLRHFQKQGPVEEELKKSWGQVQIELKLSRRRPSK